MREIVLIFVVAAICLTALVRPKWGMLGYIWFALLRPDYLSWSAGNWPYSVSIAVCLITGSARLLPQLPRRWLSNPFPLLLILFQCTVVASVLFAVDRGYSLNVYEQYAKMVLMSLWICLVFVDLEDLRLAIVVCALSMGFYGFWHGTTGVLHGGLRINFGIGRGMMAENNTFALGMSMAIPLLWYAHQMYESKWVKLGFIGLACTSSMAVILTFSRGSAIALAVGVLFIVWNTRYKLPALLALVVSAAIPVSLVLGDYTERMSRLGNFESDGSLSHRVTLLKISWQLFLQRPLTGVGFGDWNFISLSQAFAEGNRNIVHNSFAQVLVHCGAAAFVLFCALIGYAMWYLWVSSRRMKQSHPDLRPYPLALLGSLIIYVVGSLAHPRYTFDFAYMILMFTGVWWVVERQLAQSTGEFQPDAVNEGMAPPRLSVVYDPEPIGARRNQLQGVASRMRQQLTLRQSARQPSWLRNRSG